MAQQEDLKEIIKLGQLLLLFKSKLKPFLEKLKSRQSSVFLVIKSNLYGVINIQNMKIKEIFKVNG